MAVLLATVLALATIPGLALFYGGSVGTAVRIAAGSLTGLLVAAAVWFTYGHGLVFNAPLLDGFVGNPLGHSAPSFGLDSATTSAFGVASAFVAVSIVASAVAGRVRMRGWLLFAVVWISVVFLPVSYWILNESDGWAAGMVVADLGGGAYVHIVAGAAALALLVVLGRRRRGIQHQDAPVAARARPGASLVGALLLWAGWLGLNIAAEGVIDDVTGLIVLNTLVAPVAGIVGWLLAEALSTSRVSRSAPAEGLVAGLVAIVPACGSFAPGWAVGLGLLSGAVCAFAVLGQPPTGPRRSFRRPGHPPDGRDGGDALDRRVRRCRRVHLQRQSRPVHCAGQRHRRGRRLLVRVHRASRVAASRVHRAAPVTRERSSGRSARRGPATTGLSRLKSAA